MSRYGRYRVTGLEINHMHPPASFPHLRTAPRMFVLLHIADLAFSVSAQASSFCCKSQELRVQSSERVWDEDVLLHDALSEWWECLFTCFRRDYDVLILASICWDGSEQLGHLWTMEKLCSIDTSASLFRLICEDLFVSHWLTVCIVLPRREVSQAEEVFRSNLSPITHRPTTTTSGKNLHMYTIIHIPQARHHIVRVHTSTYSQS